MLKPKTVRSSKYLVGHNMSNEEQILWSKIRSFQIDEFGTTFPFVRRLANENGWKIDYANRVVEEYKKFIFLCTVGKTMVTPSDPVDQAWHLHMIYTNSYWNKLCKETLNKQIHHNPTKGGKAENDKYNNLYDRTRELYNQYFGEQPSDIWQGNEERFSDIHFQRVNTKKSWIIPKPRIFISNKLFILLFSLIALSFVMMTDGEVFWLVTIACIIAVIILIILYNSFKKGNKGGGSSSSGSGCSSGGFFIIGCSGGSDSSHSSGSSCSSGCSSSGCSSGCSGGCGGGGCSS